VRITCPSRAQKGPLPATQTEGLLLAPPCVWSSPDAYELGKAKRKQQSDHLPAQGVPEVVLWILHLIPLPSLRPCAYMEDWYVVRRGRRNSHLYAERFWEGTSPRVGSTHVGRSHAVGFSNSHEGNTQACIA